VTQSRPVNVRTFKPRPLASDSTPSAQNDTTCLIQYHFRKKSIIFILKIGQEIIAQRPLLK
jgi:hypothetical protein